MPIVVVMGPPCSGKTTFVNQRRGPKDLVLDLDVLAHAFGYPAPHVDWVGPTHLAVEAARAARTHILKMLLDQRPHRDVTAWIIDADPPSWLLKKYRAIGAEVIELDPGKRVCLERAKAERLPATQSRIRDWYSTRT